MNLVWLKTLRNSFLSSSLIAKQVQALGERLARDFVITAGANFAIALLGAGGGILAARVLGPEGRGELAAAIVWASILGTVVRLGLPQALTYFAAKRKEDIDRIFSTALVLVLLQSAAGVPVGWIVASHLLGRAQSASLPAVHISLVSIPFATMITYLSNMAQGLGRFALFNFLRVCSALGYLIAVVLTGTLGIRSSSGIVALWLCFQIGVCAVGLILFWRQVRPSWQPDRNLAHHLLAYGVKSYWAGFSYVINARLDQFLMSIFLSARELGLYAVGVSYATILFPISGAFAMITFPRVAESGNEAAKMTIRRMLIGNLATVVPLGVLAALLSPMLLPILFGSEFGESVPVATILLAGTIILGCNYVLSDGARGLGYPLIPSVSELLAVGVTVGGLTLVLRESGILGAAWVSLGSYSLTLLVLILSLSYLFQKGRPSVSEEVVDHA